MMEEKIENAIIDMSGEEFKKIIDLEERYLYYDDRAAGKELTEMCKKYGFTRKAFIDWCCE